MDLPDFFGIDLGDKSMKLAYLKSNKKEATLYKLHSSLTSVGILNNDSEKGLTTLAGEVEETYKKSGIRTRNCVMAVPEVSIFSRLITTPVADKQEDTAEAIMWAIKPLIPIAIEEVNISYLEIDRFKQGKNEMVNWYVVASPKRLVNNFQTVMSKAGLNLLAIETEALAATRAIQFNYRFNEKNVVIVDLGAESTNIILARKGVVLFSQTISTGSNAITKVIASDYGIKMEQAEKYKITYGLDKTKGEGKIAMSIEPAVNIITSEVGRTLTYFREKLGGSKISQIFLTGGGALLPKFDEHFTNTFKIKTEVADVFKKVRIDNSLRDEFKEENPSSLSISIGLALKGKL